ncbi:uncharacterized protein VTP21DRAFT_319 [Calcarisporiella thermophila]|uniref:uncharacterized protein n=1 Tax=Calcarisporiella thermophila TaxID=911321 RepID=UPI003742F2B7
MEEPTSRKVEIPLVYSREKFCDKFPASLDGYMSPQTFSLRIMAINQRIREQNVKPHSESRLTRIIFWLVFVSVVVLTVVALGITPLLQEKPFLPSGFHWGITAIAIVFLVCIALACEIFVLKRLSKFERVVKAICSELSELDHPDIAYSMRRQLLGSTRINPDGSKTLEGTFDYFIIIKFSEIPPVPEYEATTLIPPPPPTFNPSSSDSLQPLSPPPDYNTIIKGSSLPTSSSA